MKIFNKPILLFVIGIFVIISTSCIYYTFMQNYKDKNNSKERDIVYLEESIRSVDEKKVEEVKRPEVKEVNTKGQIFTVTAYDLSIQSCAKSRGSKGYGVTATGFDLKGHTWDSARVISVDPRVIPLGSRVRLEFISDKYKKYNSVYTAQDTGSAIKGNKIDFFIGDFNSSKPNKKTLEFGVTEAVITVLE